MFRSLSSRLMVSYLLVGGLVLGLVSVGLIFFLLRNPLAQRQVFQRLELSASAVAFREGSVLLAQQSERAQTFAERLDQFAKARVLVVGQDGHVQVDSRRDETQLPEEVVDRAAGAAQLLRGEYRDSRLRRWLYVAQPLEGGAILILASPRPALRALVLLGDELMPPLLQAAAVALVVSAVLAWLMARWIAAPLRRMSQAAQAVAGGDYQSRVPVAGPEEVQEVAQAFNDMVQRVHLSQQAQRDFVANVSHELKTPLTSIQGFAQAILDGTAGEGESRRRAAGVIREEADRLQRMVEDLLDLARLDSGQTAFSWEKVDLAAIARTVTDRLSLRAEEEGLKLEIEMPPIPAIVGDGDRIAQVLTNLIDNALQHTPSGGRVGIRGGVEKAHVFVEVEDTGAGIPPDELPRIFERFYQVDKARPGRAGRGVGLGLAICREIVAVHGGRLTARSAPGEGSCFRMELPLSRPSDTTLARRSR